MPISQELLEKLEFRLGVSRRRVYDLISKKVNETKLPRHLAAIDLASDYGIGIAKYATKEELDEMRMSSRKSPNASLQMRPMQLGERKGTRPRGKSKQSVKKADKGEIVFVVHGREEKLRKSMFSFLRAIGLKPIEWRKALELTKKPSPYIGEIIDAAFEKATAVIVLLTPDDEARLKSTLVKPGDSADDSELMGQPRPNVLFEAGLAFGTHADKTVLVQVGEIRPFSDVAGRHIVRLSNSADKRQELITKLRSCGCNVDDSGSDWLTEGSFG